MIHSLGHYIQENNIEYINNFLSNEVIISEKLSAQKIFFENVNNELKFYNKDFTPISKIDISLDSNLGDIMLDIKILCENKNVPENYYFSVYCCDNTKNAIQYNNINKYILSDIIKKENLKYNISVNENLIAEWSVKLSMGLPPILYKGYLSDEQKQLLINYSNNNYEFIKENKFSDFLSKNFFETYSKENVIEGIYIKSGDNIIDVISHEYKTLNESIKQHNCKNDILILYLNSVDYSKIFENFVKKEDKDINYINLICEIYNEFIKVNKSRLKIVNEHVNSDLYKNVSDKFISNINTIYLLENESNKYLFYNILDLLRNESYNTLILSEDDVNKFNSFVNDIRSFIFEENVIIQEVSKQRELNDIDNMKLIASIQNAFNTKNKNINKGLKKCILYVCDILSFTSSQLRNIEVASKQYDIPVIIFGISHNKSLPGKKYRISDNLLNVQLSSLKNSYSFISDVFILNSSNLKLLFDTVRPNFEPIQLICDNEQLISDFKNQLYFEDKILGGRINVIDNFQITKVDNEDKNSSLRAIEDGNILLFKNISPQPIINLWDMIYNEYRIWSGKILK